MPSALTFPGVYIEGIPSGVRTITRVATSVAAFAGWAPKGPTDKAELVLSFPDFERKFGGPHPESYLGSSVSQFFNTGGQKAFIIRLVTTGATGASIVNAASSTVTLNSGATPAAPVLTITAKSPGKWGDNDAIITKRRAAPDDARFQLQVANIKDDPKGVGCPCRAPATDGDLGRPRATAHRDGAALSDCPRRSRSATARITRGVSRER